MQCFLLNGPMDFARNNSRMITVNKSVENNCSWNILIFLAAHEEVTLHSIACKYLLKMHIVCVLHYMSDPTEDILRLKQLRNYTVHCVLLKHFIFLTLCLKGSLHKLYVHVYMFLKGQQCVSVKYEANVTPASLSLVGIHFWNNSTQTRLRKLNIWTLPEKWHVHQYVSVKS